MADQISSRVYEIDDQQRTILHVAAVFVNNFSNRLFQIAEEILEKEQLDFELLKPLLLETARKAVDHTPSKMQTGPAIRGDWATIERHLAYLKEHPQHRELYHMLSRSINPDYKVNQ